MSTSETIGQKIQRLRYEKGWGPDDLCARAGVSRTTLYHIEAGTTKRPRAKAVAGLARALETTARELMGDGGPPPGPGPA